MATPACGELPKVPRLEAEKEVRGALRDWTTTVVEVLKKVDVAEQLFVFLRAPQIGIDVDMVELCKGRHPVFVAVTAPEVLELTVAESEGRGVDCVVIFPRGRVLARKDAKLPCAVLVETGGDKAAPA